MSGSGHECGQTHGEEWPVNPGMCWEEAKQRHLGLMRPFRGGSLNKEATAEDRWEGTAEELGRESRRSRWGAMY